MLILINNCILLPTIFKGYIEIGCIGNSNLTLSINVQWILKLMFKHDLWAHSTFVRGFVTLLPNKWVKCTRHTYFISTRNC